MHQIINFTDEAQNHISKMLADKPEALGIRVGVKDYGCSGLGYVIDYVLEQQEDDTIAKFSEFNVYISADSLKYVKDTEVYMTAGINSVIKFRNPNASDECGCGESFQFKD